MAGTIKPICGVAVPSTEWARGWPKGNCELALGHEGDHRFTAPWSHDVSFEWPCTVADVEFLAHREDVRRGSGFYDRG
jgi:hypothetical protein